MQTDKTHRFFFFFWMSTATTRQIHCHMKCMQKNIISAMFCCSSHHIFPFFFYIIHATDTVQCKFSKLKDCNFCNSVSTKKKEKKITWETFFKYTTHSHSHTQCMTGECVQYSHFHPFPLLIFRWYNFLGNCTRLRYTSWKGKFTFTAVCLCC